MKNRIVMVFVLAFGSMVLPGCWDNVESVDFLKKEENQKELTAITIECIAKKARGENIEDDKQCVNAKVAVDEKQAARKAAMSTANQDRIEQQKVEKEKKQAVEIEEAMKKQQRKQAVENYIKDPIKMLNEFKECKSNGSKTPECENLRDAIYQSKAPQNRKDYTAEQKIAADEAWELRSKEIKGM